MYDRVGVLMKKKFIYILLTLTVSFFVKIDNTYAFESLTCKYLNPYNNAKYSEIIYSTTNGGKSYTLTQVVNGKSSKFSHKDFNSTVIEKGKCPKYVEFTNTLGNGKLNVISKNTYAGNVKNATPKGELKELNNLPLKQEKIDSKSTNSSNETFKVYLNNSSASIVSAVNKINKSLKSSCGGSYENYIDKSKYSDVTNFKSYASSDYGKVSKSSNDSKISESCWKARQVYVKNATEVNNYISKFENNTQTRNLLKDALGSDYNKVYSFAKLSTSGSKSIEKNQQLEEKIDGLEKDISSLYDNACEVLCMSDSDQAVSSCKSSNAQYSKCISAYKECENVQDSSAKEQCLSNKIGQTDYENMMKKYNETLEDLRDTLQETKYKLNKSKPLEIGVKFKPYKLKCSDVSMLHDLWVIILIVGPILAILFGILDCAKAVVAGDENKIHQSLKKLPKRIVAAVLLFLIPTLISAILSFATDENAADKSLLECIVEGE